MHHMQVVAFLNVIVKKVSLVREYHNHILQTYQQHREEEPQNIHSNITSVKQ